MKAAIHPEYHQDTTVICSCGNTFPMASTKGGTVYIELCNQCHPFYTGTQKFVDKASRIERFQKKMDAARPYVKKKTEEKKDTRALTLKEMLQSLKKQ